MASSIVKSAAKQLGSLLAEEAKSLYKVSDKIENLQTELAWMECFLRDADTQQHQEEVICMWVSQVRDIAYEAEDLVEKYLHEVSHHRQAGIRNSLKWFTCILYTCDAYTLHNLGSDIDSLRVKISELTSRLQTYGIQIIRPMAYTSVIREERRTYSHFQEDEIVGLKKDVKQIVDKLVKEDVKVVSISGIGGLGKSTLARKVFLDEDVKKHFKHKCVWVYISKQVERDSVFREILVGLLKDEDAKRKIKDLPIGELPIKICELLTQTKCFVVLDDLWTIDAWDSLKPAFATTGSCGSKILTTTRNQGLLENMDSNGYSHCLEPLSDKDSWKLFQLKAFQKIRNPVNNEEVKTKMELGKEMLKHCHGLPLAVLTLGGILVNKKTSLEWEHVQKNISSYLMTNIGTGGSRNGGLLRVLELSYHDLPFYLKPCFLYLGNFPEDYEISTQKLYQLWEAEGFLAISNIDEEVEGITSFDIGERYLHELIERSMVQVGRHWQSGRIKSCRVHDVMRDMCLKKCKEVSFLKVQQLEPENPVIVTKKVRRYAYHVKEEISVMDLASLFQLREEAKYTRSLLVFVPSKLLRFSDGRILKNIRKSYPMLRILSLDQNRCTNADSREEVGHLIHLKYLSIGRVPVMCLPSSFWDLKNLVSLDLRCPYDGNVIELPNRFHQLERLRHLYLPNSYDILDGEKLNFKAHQMVTLKNYDPEKCELGDLLQMTCLRIFSIIRNPFYALDNSEVFRLLIRCPVIQSGLLANSLHLSVTSRMMEEDPAILTQLRSNPCFTKFKMKGDGQIEQNNIDNAIGMGVDVFLPSFRCIYLHGCKLSKEIILALEKHPNLEDLRLSSVRTHRKISFSAGSFTHLKSFAFDGLVSLEEWEVEDGALSNLISLRIQFCTKLRMIPQGLPDAVRVECYDPCIYGVEKYNTCPRLKAHQQELNYVMQLGIRHEL